MNQVIRWSMAGAILLVLLSVSVLAQDPVETIRFKMADEGKAQIEVAKAMGTQFTFETKVVKGAPYSATAEAETIQMMADGNRIRNKTTTTVYRDSEGRTRKEMTGKTPDMPAQVFINDPVSGSTYTLNPQQRVATKSQKVTEVRIIEDKLLAEQKMRRAVEAGSAVSVNGQGVSVEQIDEARRVAIEQKMKMDREEIAASGKPATGAVMMRKKGGTQESLGQQLIDGVMCEGKRTTTTIPAGSIGNDLPINIVSEEWYSPELQVLVLTKQSDPRHGETIYRLTNINRSEPARALFEIPTDYSVREGGGGGFMRMKKPDEQ